MKNCKLVSIIPTDKLFTIGKFIEDNGGVIDGYSPYTNSKTARKKRHMRTEEEDKKVRKWYMTHRNDTITSIAEKFDFSSATINRIVEEL